MENLKFYLSKRNNGIYRIGYFVNSKLHWKTTGKRYKAEALSVLKDFEAAFKKPLPSRSLSSFKAEVMAYLSQCYQPGTVEIYRIALANSIEIIGDINIKDVTARHADTYKITRLQSNRKNFATMRIQPATVNCEIRTLRAAFNIALKWGLISQNPFKGTSLVLIPDTAPVFLSREAFTTLTKLISEPWLKNIIIFAALTGMRRGEIINLRLDHVDLVRKVIYLESSPTFKTKGGRRRVIPMSDSAYFLLQQLIGTRKSGYIFENQGKQVYGNHLTHRFKEYVRKCFGHESALHFHSLRHTTASWLVQSGSTLFEVMSLLGHTNSKTTQIYAHLLPENLHGTVNKIHINLG